jgi:4-amino-4-deoxychorismate lyase
MILVNGVAADSVAATDRGLAYGDGVFRTLLWRRGKPRWWPEQYLCQTRFSSQPRLAGIKHLNRLENVLARAEWNDPGVPEGLVLDAGEHIVCGTMSNLIILEEDGLVTPALTRCGVAGATRARVMEAAAKSGLACRQEAVTLARLLDAREALLVNSVIGVWQIRGCASRSWAPGAFVGRVREWLDEDG